MRRSVFKVISMFCILSISITFTACNKKPSKEKELNAMYKSVQASREQYMKRTVTLKDEYMNWDQGEDEGKRFTEEYMDKLLKYHIAKLYGTEDYDEEFKCDAYKVLIKEQALEDVEDLFNKFKLYYGSYGYFGGDAVFNKAKESIIQEVKNSGDIRVKDLSDIIFKNLEFIKDTHFLIGDNNYGKRLPSFKCYYYSTDTYDRDNKGYYKKEGVSKSYIEAVQGDKNIDSYMKQSLTKDGELCYRIAILKETENQRSINKTITYSKGKVKEESLSILVAMDKPNSAINYSIEDGIPILKVPSMKESGEFFALCGRQMKKYPVCIIDLRGNIGGDTTGAYRWIKEYTGVDPQNIGASHGTKSYLMNYRYKITSDSTILQIKEDSKQSVVKKKVSNKNKVFVLIDKNVCSASEFFVEQLMTMENVYFIGSNTMGGMQNVCLNFQCLKNSKLPVQLGIAHYETSYSNDFEYTGFDPDLLCTDDSLEAVKKFIKNYNIK